MTQDSKNMLVSHARFALLSAFVAIVCAICGIAFSGEAAYAATPDQTTASSAASVKEGWQKSGSSWKYVYSDNTFAKGFKKIDSKTYYFNDKGIMKTGWQKVSGSWYYFDRSGAMQTGWQKLSGKWYYLASNGKMLTGKRTISGKTYYFADSGVMKTGWQKISKAWYYFNNNGVMKTGWQKLSGKWYYLNSAGKMLTGWQKISNKWYFFNGSGVMQASKWIGNYWLQSSGAMATNAWVDGGRYYVDSNGAWVPNKHNTGVTSASDKALVKKMAGNWYFNMGGGMTSSSLGHVLILEDGRICDKDRFLKLGDWPTSSDWSNPKDTWRKIGETKNGVITIKANYGTTYTFDSKANTLAIDGSNNPYIR